MKRGNGRNEEKEYTVKVKYGRRKQTENNKRTRWEDEFSLQTINGLKKGDKYNKRDTNLR